MLSGGISYNEEGYQSNKVKKDAICIYGWRLAYRKVHCPAKSISKCHTFTPSINALKGLVWQMH